MCYSTKWPDFTCTKWPPVLLEWYTSTFHCSWPWPAPKHFTDVVCIYVESLLVRIDFIFDKKLPLPMSRRSTLVRTWPRKRWEKLVWCWKTAELSEHAFFMWETGITWRVEVQMYLFMETFRYIYRHIDPHVNVCRYTYLYSVMCSDFQLRTY